LIPPSVNLEKPVRRRSRAVEVLLAIFERTGEGQAIRQGERGFCEPFERLAASEWSDFGIDLRIDLWIHRVTRMAKIRARVIWAGMLALSFSSLRAQTAQQVVQQVVSTELEADQNDHSNWIYLEEDKKPKVDVLQLVATTQKGDVQRILEKDGEKFPESRQRDQIEFFLHDTRAQNKQVSETNHDLRQIDDLLKLLPSAFLWTQTDSTGTTTSFRFQPDPKFRPPTREARVFSNMTGDLTVDNQQHRIRSMTGHLTRDVTFGGGILGRLKADSSFSLSQEQVGPSLWQLTAIHVHLVGNALLFKSVSLQQDDERSKFRFEPSTMTLDQAAAAVMTEPE
jgi:hypothetical protein